MPQEAPLHISSTLAKFETEVQNRKDEASMSENEPTSLLRLKSFGFLQIAFLVTELNTRLILIKYIGEAMWILSEATWILLIPQAVYCSFLCTLFLFDKVADNIFPHLSSACAPRCVYRAHSWLWF